MSEALGHDTAAEQSTSGSIEGSGGEREDRLLDASMGRGVNVATRRASLNTKGTPHRAKLHSENNCGAPGTHQQLTNHLTVECLVSVRAQVLTWDEALGGWLPLDDGALCGVSLLQQVTCQQSLSPSYAQPTKRSSWSGGLSHTTLRAPCTRVSPICEYHIQGKRISDQTVLLNCTLMPHVTYRNAMPTFHHWRIKDQRYGLSFGSAFDASKFHNRLQKALEHLCHQSKSSSGESNIDATEDLEDDVFVPTELPDSFSSLTTTRPCSYNNMIGNIEGSNNRRVRKDRHSHSLPPLSLQCPISLIRTTFSSSPITAQDQALCDECPPMDPEMARPCVIPCFTPIITQIQYANLDATGHPLKQFEKNIEREGTNESTPDIGADERGEEDDLLITDDALSIPATLHQSFAASLSSSTRTDKTDSKGSDRHSKSRLRSKSRSEISSFECRIAVINEKMRSVSTPGTDFLFNRNRYQHFERYVSSPLAADGARSFIEAHASLYKNREHILLPKKKEMMRRECCTYCRNWYNVRDNPRGACKEAPDPIEMAIRRLTCFSVAQAAIYHCCREGDEMPVNIGRYGQGYSVCSCGPANVSRSKRLKRWLLVAVVSLFVPCLCCYPPVHSVYGCCCKGRRGRHKPCENLHETDQLLARSRYNNRLMTRLSF